MFWVFWVGGWVVWVGGWVGGWVVWVDGWVGGWVVWVGKWVGGLVGGWVTDLPTLNCLMARRTALVSFPLLMPRPTRSSSV